MNDSPAPLKRRFELLAQAVVLYSVAVFYMESELAGAAAPRAAAGFWLWNERLLAALFTAEYLCRWARAENKLRYPFTLLAIVDLLAVAPAVMGATASFRSLKLLRALPLLSMFKLYRYNGALQNLLRGFRLVGHELAVVGFVALVALLFSAVALHDLERQAQPDKFGRLPDALWWSVVTMTTVGYGDVYPVTGPGRVVAAVTMLLGIGILGTFISLIGSSLLAVMRPRAAGHEGDVAALPLADSLREPATWTSRRAG